MGSFLDKLKKEGKLEIVDPSEEMSFSYQQKARNCLQAAALVFNGELYENAVGDAYYSMYNAVQSLFFKCGIKCENHSAAAVLLKKLLGLDQIYKTFSDAKEERIDKQYYVTPTQNNPVTKNSAEALLKIASDFILRVDDFKRNLKISQIDEIRAKFEQI